MDQGVDANVNLAGHAACLVREGFSFACRYYKSVGQPLTNSEAVALSGAGLWIISMVERGFPTTAGYFTAARGAADALFARDQAQKVGQPSDSPIYFTVDYDATESDCTAHLGPYFAAVQAEFGKERPVGVYGSGLVLERLHARGVTYRWLAESRGWRGSKTATDWEIKQTGREIICGIAVDRNVSHGAAGGWRLAAKSEEPE